jgi:hypothetical protein
MNKRQRLQAAWELEWAATIGAGAGFGKYTREVSARRRGTRMSRVKTVAETREGRRGTRIQSVAEIATLCSDGPYVPPASESCKGHVRSTGVS